jgi:hypothetical protein
MWVVWIVEELKQIQMIKNSVIIQMKMIHNFIKTVDWMIRTPPVISIRTLNFLMNSLLYYNQDNKNNHLLNTSINNRMLIEMFKEDN